MAVTIDDIAKEANVSRMTVSRVINNYPHVHKDTREKILKIIKRTNFSVNLAAKNLAEGRNLKLICMITEIENLFNSFYYIHVIRAIDEHINKYGYALMISNVLDLPTKCQSAEKLEIVKNLFHSKIIKGVVILGPVVNDQRLTFLSKNNIKGIIIGGKWTKKNFGYVDIDNEDGANKALSYLVECGHKKIAMIKGPALTTASTERENAYCKFLESKKIDIKKEYIIEGNFTKESGKKALKKLLKLKSPPTAIFAGNDEEAIGIYEQAKIEGIEIPNDISVCGFDDIETASKLSPPLTTIAHPYSEVGRLIAENIINENYTAEIKLPAKLIVRESIKSI